MARAELKNDILLGWTILSPFLYQINICLHITNDTTQRILYSQFSLQHVSAA
jgi:hypothetical protein